MPVDMLFNRFKAFRTDNVFNPAGIIFRNLWVNTQCCQPRR